MSVFIIFILISHSALCYRMGTCLYDVLFTYK